MKQIKIVPVAAFIAFLFCVSPIRAGTSEREAVLRSCAESFGSMVDEKQNLFEVNRLFVVQVKFDSLENLNELAFFPKYWLEESHPEWTEPLTSPVLSKYEYEGLLTRLDKVKPKGALIKSVDSGAVTNSTAYFLAEYEHAFLRRGVRGESGVRFASLYFFHEIEGKVKKKRMFSYSILTKNDFYQVSIGRLNYFVRKEDYLKLKVGRMAKFPAIGPIKGICDGSACNP